MAVSARPPEVQTHSSELFSYTKKAKISRRLKERLVYGKPNFAIIAGDAGMYLGRKVAAAFGQQIPDNLPSFANHELKVVIPKETPVATKDVYVIQSVNGQPDSDLTQLRLLEEAAKGAGANRIYPIITHLAYSRQDRRDQDGATEAARLFVREIARAGSHDPQKKRRQHESKLRAPASLILLDIHSRKPLDPLTDNNHIQWVNLDPAPIVAPKVQRMIEKNNLDVVVAFPDTSAEEKYRPYVDMFGNGREPAIIHKVRPVDKSNVVSISREQEDTTQLVANRDVVMFDDMIDTGGSILQAAKRFKEQGAKSVRVVATHGVFSKDALQKLMDPSIDQIMVTNSIQPTEAVLHHPKIQVVSIDSLITETIKRIENRLPLGKLAKSMSSGFEHEYMKLSLRANRFRRAKRSASPSEPKS